MRAKARATGRGIQPLGRGRGGSRKWTVPRLECDLAPLGACFQSIETPSKCP